MAQKQKSYAVVHFENLKWVLVVLKNWLYPLLDGGQGLNTDQKMFVMITRKFQLMSGVLVILVWQIKVRSKVWRQLLVTLPCLKTQKQDFWQELKELYTIITDWWGILINYICRKSKKINKWLPPECVHHFWPTK